tara:strand:+ start:11382 stop:12476 length:1095 start_codon:yes stop_codon:yes gene_type:complete
MSFNSSFKKDIIIFVLLLLITTMMFVFGWYFDISKPHAGIGWADQTMYANVTERFLSGHLPSSSQFHYSIGYSLLGFLGGLITPNDPFLLVCYGFFVSSIIFCYFGSKNIIGSWWSLLFIALLLGWDGVTRTFNYSSELFFIPWNNQVMYFSFAYFFWQFSNRSKPSYTSIIFGAIIVGITFLCREESIIFLAPLYFGWLFISKVRWIFILASIPIIGLIYLPQIIMKADVLGSISDSGRAKSYSATLEQYLNLSKLNQNFSEVIVGNENTVRRKSLLQSSPWLALSIGGIVLLLASKAIDIRMKLYVLVSLWLLIFYLSGINMSAHKLQYHCLRYISPSFIVLNFSSVFFVRKIIFFLKGKKI